MKVASERPPVCSHTHAYRVSKVTLIYFPRCSERLVTPGYFMFTRVRRKIQPIFFHLSRVNIIHSYLSYLAVHNRTFFFVMMIDAHWRLLRMKFIIVYPGNKVETLGVCNPICMEGWKRIVIDKNFLNKRSSFECRVYQWNIREIMM